MASMIEIIDQLCEQNGIKGSKLCDDLGISRSTLTELRKGRAKTLSLKKTQMIADYFGVSVEYLTGNQKNVQNLETKKAPTLTKKDERDIAKTLASLKETLENEEGLMFDGDPMSDEAKESILAAMELGLQAAKLKNKEKYTPKKYKKD